MLRKNIIQGSIPCAVLGILGASWNISPEDKGGTSVPSSMFFFIFFLTEPIIDS
jgi:hypothetical protein